MVGGSSNAILCVLSSKTYPKGVAFANRCQNMRALGDITSPSSGQLKVENRGPRTLKPAKARREGDRDQSMRMPDPGEG